MRLPTIFLISYLRAAGKQMSSWVVGQVPTGMVLLIFHYTVGVMG